MESIGETLREARHQKKVTLEDAARSTKIKLDILEKLEADEFEQLVSPTYTKGFLKIYAEYLSLDSAALGEIYVRSQGGLRRQGLHIESAEVVRRNRLGELKLSVSGVVAMVGGLTALIVVIAVAVSFWSRKSEAPVTASAPVTLPRLETEAYYVPETKTEPALLALPSAD